ncbi:MAG: hypothetical protein V9G19_08765 [Tetrasphaera sp.]
MTRSGAAARSAGKRLIGAAHGLGQGGRLGRKLGQAGRKGGRITRLGQRGRPLPVGTLAAGLGGGAVLSGGDGQVVGGPGGRPCGLFFGLGRRQSGGQRGRVTRLFGRVRRGDKGRGKGRAQRIKPVRRHFIQKGGGLPDFSVQRLRLVPAGAGDGEGFGSGLGQQVRQGPVRPRDRGGTLAPVGAGVNAQATEARQEDPDAVRTATGPRGSGRPSIEGPRTIGDAPRWSRPAPRPGHGQGQGPTGRRWRTRAAGR